MNYFVNEAYINTLVEELGTDATSSASRVRAGLDSRYLQRGLQLRGAQYSANFHFPTGTAARSEASYRLNNNTNWINNQVCRIGFAPMARNLRSWARQGQYVLQYDVGTGRARWTHELGNGTGHNNINQINHSEFDCPACVIVVAVGAGGAGFRRNMWFTNNNGGGGGGSGGIAVAQINLFAMATANGVGSEWRNCLRVNAGGSNSHTTVRRALDNVLIMQGSHGQTGGYHASVGAGGGFSVVQQTGIVKAAGHTSAAGQASPTGGRTGTTGAFTSNIYAAFGTGSMGRVNQAAVSSSFGQRGNNGNNSSGGAGGFYGNGGNGGASNSNGSGGGIGAGGGGVGGHGPTTNAGSPGSGGPGLIAIYF